MVFLAFFYDFGRRFRIQVDFYKITVFVFLSYNCRIQVGLEGAGHPGMAVRPPAFRFQLQGRNLRLMPPADFYELYGCFCGS